MGIEAIEVKGDKTVKGFMDELNLPTAILLAVNGEVFYPDEHYARVLREGDTVTLIPIIAGG